MKIRMKINLGGHTSIGPGVGVDNLTRGQILEVSDTTAAHFIENGYAETTLTGPIGPAYKAG
jgi:hypothetical protein